MVPVAASLPVLGVGTHNREPIPGGEGGVENHQGRLRSIPDGGPARHAHTFELEEGEWKGAGTHHRGPGSTCHSPLGEEIHEDPGRKPPISCQAPMREDGHVKPLALSKRCQAESECLLSTY